MEEETATRNLTERHSAGELLDILFEVRQELLATSQLFEKLQLTEDLRV